jgi:hypothetical protein
LYLGECSLEFLAAYGVDGEVERAVDDGAEPAKQVKDAGEGPFLVAQLQPLHKPVSRNPQSMTKNQSTTVPHVGS